jgi:succinate-semialdehyde dehydrogenase/glutarate-semialdehyde dehydrogenase
MTTQLETAYYPEIVLAVAGREVGPADRATSEILDPATEEVIGLVPHATAADLDDALTATEPAFRTWKRVSAFDRAALVHRAAGILRDRAERIAVAMVRENGKTKRDAVAEVLVSADLLDWLAEEARRSYGRVIPSRVEDGRVLVVQEPVGPVAAFTPWNAPALTLMRKVGPAIAAGCSVIAKASEETPATAVEIYLAFRDAGLPDGVFQLVFGEPDAISRHLLASAVIRKVSFTGSVRVGVHLTKLAADTMKRVTMELGGHGPVIVAEDADVDLAVRETASFKFRQTGQICAAPSRFFIHESLYAEFAAKFTAHARSVVVGNGLDEATTMGPLSNDRRLAAMEEFVADAVARGGTLLTGGQRIGTRGYFFEPTVIGDVTDDFDVMRSEIFGPIAPLARFTDLDDAIARANSSALGLTAFTFTENERTARRLSNEVEAGLVTVNTGGTSLPETPFGGVKLSGYGHEGGIEGLEAYMTRKLINQL